MAVLAPGTQWSQKPTERLPAAWAPRTCGIASRAAEAAVVARRRRRVSLRVRMGFPSGGSDIALLPDVLLFNYRSDRCVCAFGDRRLSEAYANFIRLVSTDRTLNGGGLT